MQWFKKTLFSLPYWLIIASSIFILSTIVSGVIKYNFFLYSSLDLAIFNHTFFQTINGSILGSSIHPPSYLGDHFAPLLLMLVPLYALFPHPVTLLVLQTFFIASAALPLYGIAKRYLSQRWIVAIILSWLLNPFVGSLSLFEWHIASLLPVLLLSLWYFFITKKRTAFFMTLLVTLLLREDTSFAVIGLGCAMLFFKREYRHAIHYGLISITTSVVWTLLTLKLIPYFSITGSYKFFYYYGWLGNSPLEALQSILSKPIIFFSHLLSFNVLGLFLLILLPVVFLLLLSPSFFLGLGVATMHFLLSSAGGSSLLPFLHYGAWMLPFVYLGTIYGVRVLNNPKNNNLIVLLKKQQEIIYLSFVVSMLYFFIALHPGVYILYKSVAEKDMLTQQQLPKLLLSEYIPDDAGVITTQDFLTHLSSRKNIYNLQYLYTETYQLSTTPYKFPDNADFLLFRPTDIIIYDQLHRNSFIRNNTAGKKLDEFIRSHSYTPIIITNDYILLKKDRNDFFEYYKVVFELPNTITPLARENESSTLQLLGWDPISITSDHILATMYFEKAEESDSEIYFQITLENEEHTFTSIVPTSFGLVSTTAWPQNSVIKTRLLLSNPFDSTKGERPLQLHIEPVEIEGENILNRYATTEFKITDITSVGAVVTIDLKRQE